MKVELYNNISRQSIHKSEKLELKSKFEDFLKNGGQDKSTTLLLLSYMLLFKCYRTHKNCDEKRQENCLEHIEHLAQGLNLKVEDIFSFMRNRSYFMQRALPNHFKNLLLTLNVEELKAMSWILSNIDSNADINAFLVDNDLNKINDQLNVVAVLPLDPQRLPELENLENLEEITNEEKKSTTSEEKPEDANQYIKSQENMESNVITKEEKREIKPQKITEDIKSSTVELLQDQQRVPELEKISQSLYAKGLIPNTDYVTPQQIKYVVSGTNSNEYLDTLKQMFDDAEHSFMLSSLSPPKANLEDEYYKIFLEGIKTIAKKNKKSRTSEEDYIPITLLFGNAPTILNSGVEFNPNEYMQIILNNIDKELHEYIRLEVAAYNPKLDSWNHSKIIVIDGKKINVGGINLFSEYNKDNHKRPRDLAVTIENKKMARSGESFIESLLKAKAQNISGNNGENNAINRMLNSKFTHFNPKVLWNGKKIVNELLNPQEFEHMYERYKIQDQDESEEIKNGEIHNVMSVPTFGLSENKIQTSEVVALEVIKNAKKTLKISQQSILFMYGGTFGQQLKGQYSSNIIKAIGQAIKTGVKVQILVSPDQCTAENGNSYDGMSTKELKQAIFKNLELRDQKSNQDLLEIKYTCDKDKNPVPNHTKLVMADDKIITIGSHNSYDNSHAEYTQLIVGEDFGKKLNTDYWNIMWQEGQTGEEFELLS